MNKQLLNQKNFYRTSDMALATTLSLFYPIENIDRSNPNRVSFLFKLDSQLNSFLKKYWQRKIKVDPQQYFQQLKIIKSRLYER